MYEPGPALGPQTIVTGLQLKEPFEWRMRKGLSLFYMDKATREAFFSRFPRISMPDSGISVAHCDTLRGSPWCTAPAEFNNVPYPEVTPLVMAALLEGQWKGEAESEGKPLWPIRNRFSCLGLVMHLFRATSHLDSNEKEWCLYPRLPDQPGISENWFGEGRSFSMTKAT